MHSQRSAADWSRGRLLLPRPPESMSAIELVQAIASSQGANVTRRQVAQAGMTRAAVRRRLATGEWIEPHRGVLRSAAVGESAETAAWAAVLACGDESVLGYLSTAHRHGLCAPVREIHVVVPYLRGPEPSGVVLHRSRRFLAGDRICLDGMPCTSVERTLVDCAQIATYRRLQSLVDRAVRDGKTTREALAARCASAIGKPGMAAIARILESQPEGIERHDSGAESAFATLAEARWPGRWVHHLVVATSVRDYEVDFAFADVRVAVEVDGPHHRLAEQRAFDRARDEHLRDAGWEVVHVDDDDAVRRPHLVFEKVDAVLRSRSRRPAV